GLQTELNLPPEDAAARVDVFRRKLDAAELVDPSGALPTGRRIDSPQHDRPPGARACGASHCEQNERDEWCDLLHQLHLIRMMFATTCVIAGESHVPLSRRCQPRSKPAARSIGSTPTP